MRRFQLMKTITITTGLPRLETIQDQFKYALGRLTDMSYERRLVFVREIKNIYKIGFYGLIENTKQSPLQPLEIIMDWNEHERLVKSTPHIARNNKWQNEVNPDVYEAVQEFATYCGEQSLYIDYRVAYSTAGQQNKSAVQKKLGLITAAEGDRIIVLGGNSVQHKAWGIGEMSLRKPLY